MARLDSPNTKAGRALDGKGPTNEHNAIAELGNFDLDNTGVVDEYSLTQVDRNELGIKDDETIIYPARDESWGSRRFAQIRRRYGTARQIKNPETGEDPCDHMANMMVAIPRKAYETRLETQRQAAIDHAGRVNPDSGRIEKDTELFETTPENFRLRRRVNEQMFEQMEIGSNGPTQGMTLEEGFAYYKERGIDVEYLADRARTGGRHREDNQANWKRAMRGEKRQYAIGADYAPDVTPTSALGQVQARNKQRAAAPKAR